MPWWGWTLVGFAVGALVTATPVWLFLRSFLRSLDEATGWGGWSRRRR